jgi:predicted DNA binding CopG/RHH family protein
VRKTVGKLWFVLRSVATSDETWLAQGDTPWRTPFSPYPQTMNSIDTERRNDLDALEALLAPILPKIEEQADTTITIRLTASLKESLRAEAEARGMNLSDYVRLKLSDQPLSSRRRVRPPLGSIERSLLVELNRIGINLNQAMRKLNSSQTSHVNHQILVQLLQIIQRIELAITGVGDEPEG